MEKNEDFKRIYCLTKEDDGKLIERFWGKEFAYLTEEEIEELIEDYSLEEIIDMDDGRRVIGSHTYSVVESNLTERSETPQNKEINLYSKFYLPIKMTHDLVKAGIRTDFDLLMMSEDELNEILDNQNVKMIIAELDKHNLYLRGSDKTNRLNSIDKMLTELRESRLSRRVKIQLLEEAKRQMQEKMKEETILIEQLEREQACLKDPIQKCLRLN